MALGLIAAAFVMHAPLLPLQGGGYVPIVEHQGDNPPQPVPPTYPVPVSSTGARMMALAAQATPSYIYSYAMGSQGDFSELSANYQLSVEVIVDKVDGKVTKTRPLEGGEKVSGEFLNRSVRVASNDRSYGKVRHGKASSLKFENMKGLPVQLTLKRVFPVDSKCKVYHLDFIVP